MPKIEVAYALPKIQELLELKVENGTTVAQAVELSGLRRKYPELNVMPGMVGIFSKKVPLDYVLAEGDRVEIYRELELSPKEARRLRALKKRQ